MIGHWPQRATFGRLVLIGLVVIGLLLTAADSWQTYFKRWPNIPNVRTVYHAELLAIGDYLDANPPPTNTTVFIAHDFVADATPRSFIYYSGETANWFDYQTSFSWRPNAAETWYFVAENKPILTEALTRLTAVAQSEQLPFSNGDPAFTVHRLTGQDLIWQPGRQRSENFIDGPQLIGFDLQEPLNRGEPADMVLHFQIPPGLPNLPNRLTYAQVFLEDQEGNIWSRTERLLGYPEAGWQAGDRFVLFLTLDVPQGMPPGPTYLRFGLRDWSGPVYGTIEGESEPAGPFIVRSRPKAEITLDPQAPIFDQTLALADHTFSTLMAPGVGIDLALDWLALESPKEDYRVRIELVNPETGQDILGQTFELWPETYPPTQWLKGEQITTFHRLNVPLDLPIEVDPVMRIQLLAAASDELVPLTSGDDTLAQMALSLREHRFELPEIPNPLEATFGDNIRLLGYELNSQEGRPGGDIVLTLYWQAIDTPEDAYTVFNHLVDANGQIQGQFDSPPVGDAWLTNSWLPGEIIIEERIIPIRPNAAPGRMNLIVGLYQAETGTRLPVTVGAERKPGDQLLLTEIEIRP